MYVVEAVFFSALYRSYWKTLCQKLRANFGEGPPDPEDITQLAFIKYSQQVATKPIENPQGYLYTLAKNLYIDQYRSQIRYDGFIDEIFSDLALAPIGANSSEDVTLQSEKLAIIDSALKTLTDKQLQIVKANRIQGETYQQISQSTGYSISDICRTLEAVNKILQQAIRNWENGIPSPTPRKKKSRDDRN
ncbi:RNA polymerase sigma factor [Aestuariibacter sp. A3R04]|uniref:RNA polymerase sigma factor n=1 Tax=Aestuariibacter sp. A3R04 TaxID=2841571 RepID=UPI001C087414|nr:sigma-70 family RNA polymerase sigma factor [Aestuariibacter sp. A3R04]MBU3021284.1 sigma-70 family RNA polymerase sigma factor [Aestuariibacter sp. A3R04]